MGVVADWVPRPLLLIVTTRPVLRLIYGGLGGSRLPDEPVVLLEATDEEELEELLLLLLAL